MPESTDRSIIIRVSCLVIQQECDINEIFALTSRGYDFSPQFLGRGQLFESEDRDADFAHNLQVIRDQVTYTGAHAYVILKFAAQCPTAKIVVSSALWRILQELNASFLMELWQSLKLFEEAKLRIVDEQSEELCAPERVYASLRVASINLDPEEITKDLGVAPTSSFKKDTNNTFGRWSFSTKNKYLGNPSELGGHVTHLINRTQVNSAHIQRWISAGHDPVLLFFWAAKSQISRAFFRKSDIELLVSLGLDVVIDCYI